MTLHSLAIGIAIPALSGALAYLILATTRGPMNYAHESLPRFLEKLTQRGRCYCGDEVVKFLAEDSSPRALWFRDQSGDEVCFPLWVGGFEVLDADRFRVNLLGQWITFDLGRDLRKGARNG